VPQTSLSYNAVEESKERPIAAEQEFEVQRMMRGVPVSGINPASLAQQLLYNQQGPTMPLAPACHTSQNQS